MARPTKGGIDYFPLDCIFNDEDEKMNLLEAEFGLKGFGIVIKLWQKIYSQGFYCRWTNEVALLFSRSVGEGCSVVSEIVDASIKRGIFDANLYKNYGILTSKGIQKRYFEITERRKEVEIEKQYLLVNAPRNSVIVDINAVNVCNNSKNASNNQQSKVKESKGKESKVVCSERQEVAHEPAIKLPLNDGSLHSVSEDDVAHYRELYPAVDVMAELRKMLGWLESNRSRRKTKSGIKNFITSWLSREQDRGRTAPKPEKSSEASYDIEEFNRRSLTAPPVYRKDG